MYNPGADLISESIKKLSRISISYRCMGFTKEELRSYPGADTEKTRSQHGMDTVLTRKKVCRFIFYDFAKSSATKIAEFNFS